MENKTISLTDEIYQALVDGLKTGLDWTHFLAEYGASKGRYIMLSGDSKGIWNPKLELSVKSKLGWMPLD